MDPTERRFFYDPPDRLEKATDLAGGVFFKYGYDGVGNRTSQAGGSGAATYGYATGTDRLDAATDPGTQALSRDFADDAYGNRTYDGAAPYAGTPSLLYDDSNRLIEMRHGNQRACLLAPPTCATAGVLTWYCYDLNLKCPEDIRPLGVPRPLP